MEAMAAGRPVLATRVGALSELVGHDRGALCEPGDVQGMAEHIRRLMADDDLCRRAGDRAAAFARVELSPARHRSQLEAAYGSAIASVDGGVGLEENDRA
jgi:glycosyltransferase involved in cell wall biosynthesis